MGIALHNCHDATGSFPKATQNGGALFGGNRQGWFPYMLPYIEQDGVGRLYDPTIGPFGTTNSNTPASPTNVVISTAVCPSDPSLLRGAYPWGYFALGNYPDFFGGRDLGTALAATPAQRAAFGIDYGARVADILDGPSNSLLMGEYLRSVDSANDQRGMLWQADEPGGGHFYAFSPPNASTPDVFYPAYWCIDRPTQNLPCVTGSTTGTDHTATARSRHPDDVSVLLGDGSTRFVTNAVNPTTWRNLVTIAGDETLGDF